MNTFKMLLKYLILFFTYGCIYYCIELIYRGFSDVSMIITAGFSGIAIGLLNEFFSWETPFWKQCMLGAIIVTVLECITGYIVNIWLGMNVWDYSNLPLSFFHGQINLFFTIAWFFLSAIAIILDDWLRYWLFKEEKPHYKWV